MGSKYAHIIVEPIHYEVEKTSKINGSDIPSGTVQVEDRLSPLQPLDKIMVIGIIID